MRAHLAFCVGLVVSLAVGGCSRVQQTRDSAATADAAPDASYAAAPGAAPGMSLTPPEQSAEFNREAYAHVDENEFLSPVREPLSTFSIDVDTASYANVRRILREGRLPPAGAVRIEELVNYFTYDYAGPDDGAPFSVHAEVAGCPWRLEHRLVRIGLQGRTFPQTERPVGNFVFLIDVSGSMDEANKLPLVKRSLLRLVDELGADDRIAVVTYAGESGVALPSTRGSEKHEITTVIDRLGAGGSTHGSQGIVTAYEVAREHFRPEGVNRVILCTDGDFNVGVTSESELVDLIEREARSGVFLSVLGFGTGNYQDARMEQLADHGNGNYAYIDTYAEARKVLIEQLTGTLVTIAKDVKIQVEFNPTNIAAYRLIGYENRRLAAEDFRDDQKDAGEIGAGHTVTALYEIVPVGVASPVRSVPDLRYQQPQTLAPAAGAGELLTVRLRYKQPDESDASEFALAINDAEKSFDRAGGDFQFATAVAAFGMLLRNSAHSGNATWSAIDEWARPSVGEDAAGYRREFLELVALARRLDESHVSHIR